MVTGRRIQIGTPPFYFQVGSKYPRPMLVVHPIGKAIRAAHALDSPEFRCLDQIADLIMPTHRSSRASNVFKLSVMYPIHMKNST